VYVLIQAVAPWSGIRKSALAAFGIAVAVELSQLYHAPWIDAIRATRLGALAIGSVFNWPDLPAYACGVALGAFIDCLFLARRCA
jgi:hypothetical protein